MLARWGHLLWDEAGVPRENPPLKAGDHHTLSYTATVDHGDRTRVAAVKSECIKFIFKDVCLSFKLSYVKN